MVGGWSERQVEAAEKSAVPALGVPGPDALALLWCCWAQQVSVAPYILDAARSAEQSFGVGAPGVALARSE